MYDNVERKQLLIDVARMYYFENLSQQQIASVLHMSRSNVSLLLKACLDSKVIEIKINDAVSRAHELAEQIRQKYGIGHVLIAKSFTEKEGNLGSVARLAAHYLRNQLSNGMSFGYVNDPLMDYLARSLYFPEYVAIHSIQLMGGTHASFCEADGQALAKHFQSKLGGTAHVLHAPLMVRSSTLKKLLLSEPIIQETMSAYADVDIAAVCIEKPDLQYGAYFGSLSKTDLLQLSELGAVCQFCGHYFDREGKACNAGISDRSIAISLPELRALPNVIGMAAGAVNALAVISALKSGYIDTLIVDESLAKSVI